MAKEKRTYAASPESFNMLGLYDEVYSLYEEINEASERIMQANANPHTGVYQRGTFDLHDLSLSTIKKILNPFYAKNISLFTDEYEKMFVNTEALRNVYFVKCNMDIDRKTHQYVYSHKFYPFKCFPETLEYIAVKILLTYKKNKNPSLTFDDVLKDINFRLKMLTSQAWSERKVDLSQEEIPFECRQLHVFRSLHQVSCVRNSHDLVPDTRILPLVGRNKTGVRLPIHRCNTCCREFIGFESYKLFCGEYGLLFFERITDEDLSAMDFFGFKAESKLHRMGYNVVDGQLSEKERRSILTMLLETNTMRYSEICSDIEKAIRLFQSRPNYMVAVDKWRRDLEFLGNYVMDQESRDQCQTIVLF